MDSMTVTRDGSKVKVRCGRGVLMFTVLKSGEINIVAHGYIRLSQSQYTAMEEEVGAFIQRILDERL